MKFSKNNICILNLDKVRGKIIYRIKSGVDSLTPSDCGTKKIDSYDCAMSPNRKLFVWCFLILFTFFSLYASFAHSSLTVCEQLPFSQVQTNIFFVQMENPLHCYIDIRLQSGEAVRKKNPFKLTRVLCLTLTSTLVLNNATLLRYLYQRRAYSH